MRNRSLEIAAWKIRNFAARKLLVQKHTGILEIAGSETCSDLALGLLEIAAAGNLLLEIWTLLVI